MAQENRQNELDHLKRNIDLRRYLTDHGWTLDTSSGRPGSKESARFRNGADLIIVDRKKNDCALGLADGVCQGSCPRSVCV